MDAGGSNLVTALVGSVVDVAIRDLKLPEIIALRRINSHVTQLHILLTHYFSAAIGHGLLFNVDKGVAGPWSAL